MINKLVVLTAAVVALSFTNSVAQDYKKGDNLLNVGVGLGGSVGTPFGASFEHGFTDKISGGGMISYSSVDLIGTKISYTIFGARASYHFDFGVKGLDPYAGAMLGYNVAGATAIGAAGGFTWGGHAGARYYFTDKIGAFAEVGYGIANLNIGAAFKF